MLHKNIDIGKVERAFYTGDAGRALEMLDRFDRIYFGCEFCDVYIPSLPAVLAVARACEENGRGFTLVTPLATDQGILKIKKLFARLKGLSGCEVVVNDWGVLQLAKSYSNITPVAGRLLVKQKSDPRLKMTRTLSGKSFFIKTSADNAQFAELLRENGIKRIDLDKPLAGMEPPAGFDISLHHPFVFLTLTMGCRADECSTCDGRTFTMKSEGMPVDLLLVGNAQFYRNEDLSIVIKSGADRLIISESPPR